MLPGLDGCTDTQVVDYKVIWRHERALRNSRTPDTNILSATDTRHSACTVASGTHTHLQVSTLSQCVSEFQCTK